jgi:hypothetical protein
MSNPEMYDVGWEEAINMVLDVVGDMYNSGKYNQATLEELRQRIV